jgi:fibronectin-binding autotransporter adhesin
METQSASGFQVTRVSTDNASVNASTGTFNPGTSTTLTNNALGGTGSIVKTGVGTMILDVNASVYSGGTVLSGSTLTLGSTNTSNISHAVSLSGAAVTGVTESFSFPSGGTLTLDSNTLGLVSDGTYYIHRTSTGAPITDIFSLPEPGSTLLLASGIGALLLRRRRTPRS